MTVLLAVQGVTKVFGGLVAVDKVEVDIEAGSIASLIGPNGAGKTTLFNCLTVCTGPKKGRFSSRTSPWWACVPTRSRLAASPAPTRISGSSAG